MEKLQHSVLKRGRAYEAAPQARQGHREADRDNGADRCIRTNGRSIVMSIYHSETWTGPGIRGGGSVYHRVRVECADWSHEDFVEEATAYRSNIILIAESALGDFLVRTYYSFYESDGYYDIDSWRGYDDDNNNERDQKTSASEMAFSDAIEMHEEWAAEVLTILDAQDELIAGGGAVSLSEGAL